MSIWRKVFCDLGFGRKLMAYVIHWADEVSAELVLAAVPYSEALCLSQSDLPASDDRRGFRLDEDWKLLVRHPKANQL